MTNYDEPRSQPDPPPPPDPSGPLVRERWYRRWHVAYGTSRTVQIATAVVAVFVALVLLAVLVSLPRPFAWPTSIAGGVWWLIKLIIIVALIWLAWRLLAHTVIGSVALAVIALLLLGPFLIGLIAGVVHVAKKELGSSPSMTTTTAPPVTVTPTETAPAVTVTPTETAPAVTETPTVPNDQPPQVPPPATVPPVPTEQPEPPATAPVPVSITAPTGSVGRVFSLYGVGDIPAGRQLIVFVRAPATGLYHTDGNASAQAGHRWVAPEVYLGSKDACDNGHDYTVYAVMADDATAATNSAFHAADPDAGYTPAEWSSRFGGFTSDSVTVTRDGTIPAKC